MDDPSGGKMSLESQVQFSVFTKPWKKPLPELARLVKSWGFDGIELPVRPGYQVLPEDVGRNLPRAANVLADEGLKIFSVAGPADEATLAACAESGIGVIRIMAPVGMHEGYMEAERRYQRELDALLPLLDQYGVKIGVQNHVGRFICNAMGLRHLIEKYNPRQIGAVWDAAHTALSGEEPELAIDIVWPHLCMVNLKNAFWNRTNGPEAEEASWHPWWTSGRQGLASWGKVAAELKRRAYQGVVCLTAEYSDESSVERLVASDLLFARTLFL
jgi:sugar phosphate isomerase/epimerase